MPYGSYCIPGWAAQCGEEWQNTLSLHGTIEQVVALLVLWYCHCSTGMHAQAVMLCICYACLQVQYCYACLCGHSTCALVSYRMQLCLLLSCICLCSPGQTEAAAHNKLTKAHNTCL